MQGVTPYRGEDAPRVTLEILSGPRDDVTEDGWEHYAYDLRLHYNGRTMDVPFKVGTGWTEDPTARDVLENLLSDASSAHYGPTFEQWAEEYGYDTDSRKAEQTYRAVMAQTRKLKRLLGVFDFAAVLEYGDTEQASLAYAEAPA